MRTFKIEMSNKRNIPIEAQEVEKVIQAIRTASPAILKQGIFNPSHYVDIVEDKDREYIREKDNNGHYTGKSIPKPLEDIFAGIEALAELKSAEAKRLK